MLKTSRLTSRLTARAGLAARLALGAALVLQAPISRACEVFADGFTILHTWTYPSQPGAIDAPVYFSVDSVLGADKLVRASSLFADRVELRGSEDLTTPALSDIAFNTATSTKVFGVGQAHLLLRGLRTPMQEGRAYMLMLEFENAGKVMVMVQTSPH